MTLPELPSNFTKIVLGFIGAIFVANVLLLDFFFVSQRNSLMDFQTRLTQLAESFRILGGRLYTIDSSGQAVLEEPQAAAPVAVNNNSCPVACLDLIALSTSAAKLSTRSLVAPVFQGSTTTTTTSTKGEYFVPLGSGTITESKSWTNVDSAQATFDASNYGSIKAAYFEAFLRRSTTAVGEVYARLFDSTTPAILWGSEMSATAVTSTYQSKQITLSSGQKVYKVQMYSTNGTSYLDQARIRIVTQ